VQIGYLFLIPVTGGKRKITLVENSGKYPVTVTTKFYEKRRDRKTSYDFVNKNLAKSAY